jgi:hypothetical protein
MLLKLALQSVTPEQWLAKVNHPADAQAIFARRAEYPLLDRVCTFISEQGNELASDELNAARGWLQMVDWLTQIAEEQPRYEVFLSYAHADASLAADIHSALKSRGRTCFMAEKDIPIATEWEKQIHNALLGCSYFLVLLTPNSKDRPWVLLESGGAWALGKRVIPATAYIEASTLPETIRKFQTRPVQSQTQIEQLVEELRNA